MRRNISLFSLATLAIAATLSSAHRAQAQLPSSASLTAEVSSLRNKTGQVCFSLFDSSKGFPNDNASIVETKCVSAAPQSDAAQSGAAQSETAQSEMGQPETAPQHMGTQDTEAQTSEAQTEAQTSEEAENAVSVTFESLPLGTYAVSVFHDENEDGQINQGGFGIPLEGFGFSQNPSITTRAPEFSETAIIVVGSETKTEIELIYY